MKVQTANWEEITANIRGDVLILCLFHTFKSPVGNHKETTNTT